MAECIDGDSGGTVCRCKFGNYDSNGYDNAGGVCTSSTYFILDIDSSTDDADFDTYRRIAP